MTVGQVLVLAIVQGLCELLPVSSSAHVIVAEKLMGLDPTAPEMTLLLVMLHTGTMFAVIGYFWSEWKASWFASRHAFLGFAKLVVIATAVTGIVGLALLLLIERVAMRGHAHPEVEQLFGNVRLIATGLTAAGVLIIVSSLRARRARRAELAAGPAAWIGAVQGLCIPFRGFSRSGATISTGLIAGIDKATAESFSFALAIVLTPPAIAREAWRLVRAHSASTTPGALSHLFAPSLAGMVMSFVAGWLALKWLSRWLERGMWYVFGIYCIVAAAALLAFAS